MMKGIGRPITALILLLAVVCTAAVYAGAEEPGFGGEVGARQLDAGTCPGNASWEFYANGELILKGSGAIEDNCRCWEAYRSEITKISIRTGVIRIGDNAFADCTAVTAVRYSGSYPQWCSLEIGENNLPLTTLVVTFPNCTGWVAENGTWYFYDADHLPVKSQWVKDSVGWVWLGEDGAMVKNAWLTDSQGLCYAGPDGYCVTQCWMEHAEGWVYFGDSGSVTKNAWMSHNGKWRYLGADGFAVTECWQQDSSGWAWLDEEGYMTYDRWVTVDGKTYYCGEDGYRVTGEVTIGENTYQFDEDGVLLETFRVEFLDWDGTVLAAGDYLQGETVTLPAEPVRQPDENYTYTFAGWTPEVTAVTGDATYTAAYTATKIETVESAIVAQPQSATVDSGSDVQFTVKTTGEVKSYKWEYRKLYKWFSTTMTGYNTDTLTVAATGQRNGYDYRCTVTFADGTQIVSEPAELTVKTYMNITYHPNDQVVVLGYKGQFTAAAEGEGIKYQWQYQRPDSELWIDTAMEGATKATVMIETTAARNGYQYRCRITDVTGNERFTEVATMHVLSFTDHPDEAWACVGDKVEFTVAASVPEGYTYRWEYSANNGESWTGTTMTGYNTATLVVDATLARNGYQYRCVLTGSKNSTIASKPAVLHVGNPVEFTAQPADVTCAVGEVATFTVEATNAYAYQWQFYNPINAVWKNTSADGNQTATVNVTVKANNNNYRYRCIVYGLDGIAYISDPATLTVN